MMKGSKFPVTEEELKALVVGAYWLGYGTGAEMSDTDDGAVDEALEHGAQRLLKIGVDPDLIERLAESDLLGSPMNKSKAEIEIDEIQIEVALLMTTPEYARREKDLLCVVCEKPIGHGDWRVNKCDAHIDTAVEIIR